VKNETCGREDLINYPHSPVKVMIIPTDEEVMIARDTIKYAAVQSTVEVES